MTSRWRVCMYTELRITIQNVLIEAIAWKMGNAIQNTLNIQGFKVRMEDGYPSNCSKKKDTSILKLYRSQLCCTVTEENTCKM